MASKFRILSIDGGGIRGLVPAMVLVSLEERIAAITHEERPLSDYFHMFAGTSTPEIFPTRFRLFRMLLGLVKPKFSNKGLKRAVKEEIGESPLSQALRDVVITAYDMTKHEPVFFKRWRAREGGRNPTMADAAIATASAPTYLPPYELEGSALIDGGVFAANPTIAAIAEALKRERDDPADLELDDLFVVSLGTGFYRAVFAPRRLRCWGALHWVWPRGSEPALMRSMIDGQTSSADHWADTLLNIEAGKHEPSRTETRRYYRIESALATDHEMDDARGKTLKALEKVANDLIADRSHELDAIARELAAAGPIPPLAS